MNSIDRRDQSSTVHRNRVSDFSRRSEFTQIQLCVLPMPLPRFAGSTNKSSRYIPCAAAACQPLSNHDEKSSTSCRVAARSISRTRANRTGQCFAMSSSSLDSRGAVFEPAIRRSARRRARQLRQVTSSIRSMRFISRELRRSLIEPVFDRIRITSRPMIALLPNRAFQTHLRATSSPPPQTPSAIP